MRVLFLASRVPTPSLRGDQLRAFQQLRVLGRRHRVTLVAFAEPDTPRPLIERAGALCERVVTVPLRRTRAVTNALRTAISPRSLQVAWYSTSAMRAAVRAAWASEAFDVVHVQLIRMAPYLGETGVSREACARVVDLVDAISLNMYRRWLYDRGPVRWIARLEATRLLRCEQAICRTAERVVVSSERDRDAIGSFPNLVTVANAVDPKGFPFDRSAQDANAIVLSGNMGYFPNRDAAHWFVERVLPRVRHEIPEVVFRIVGARPTPAVRRLADRAPNVSVAGFVEDMAAHIRRASVAIAPVRAGSGQQLKILEAMASGTPVVATALTAAAIGAHGEEHLLVADTPEAFSRQVLRLLRDRDLAARLAENGRRLVEARHTWERSVAELESVYEDALGEGRRRRPVSAPVLLSRT